MEELLEQYAHAAETPDVFYTAVLSFALLTIGVVMACVEAYCAVKHKTSESSNAPLLAVLSIAITYVIMVVGVLSSGYVRYSDYTALQELEPQVAQAIKDDVHENYDVVDMSLDRNVLTTVAKSYLYDDESFAAPVSVEVSPEVVVMWDMSYSTKYDRIVLREHDESNGANLDNGASGSSAVLPQDVVKK